MTSPTAFDHVTSADSGAGAPSPPLDPECAAGLAMFKHAWPADVPNLVSALRAPSDTFRDGDDLDRSDRWEITERLAPGLTGEPPVSLVVCQPAHHRTSHVLVYLHGGGMVSGHSRSGLADVLEVAQDLGSTVVSVDYRLAPETRHPGPVNDCFSALTWIGDHATELGAPNGHVIVLGSSAGGGLAAGAVLMARDRGYPAVSGMMLLSPMLDDRDTYSAHQMAGIDTWDLAKNHVGWDALLGEARGTDGVSPYAAPGRAADLAKLPATYVEVGSAETFRDESVSFASRIWEAGGAGELHIWPGTFHGFDVVAPRAPLAQLARHTRLEWLQRLISTFN